MIGVSIALPFIGVRVIYMILSGFSPATESIAPDGVKTYHYSDSGLGMFNATSGSWVLFLIMSLAMEYISVVIFAVTGMRLGDNAETKSWGSA